jgi:hypothetical protein
MKKNDVFTFTAPNGEEVTGVVVDELSAHEVYATDRIAITYLCYAQNRLFTLIIEKYYVDISEAVIEQYRSSHPEAKIKNKYWEETERCFGKVLADYAILPDYDDILENYQHQIDMANDYADKTL